MPSPRRIIIDTDPGQDDAVAILLALGRIRAGYTKKQMDGGKTFAEFAAEREAFYANPRGKQQPKPVWHLVISDDPADKAVALAWYRSAVAEGFKI